MVIFSRPESSAIDSFLGEEPEKGVRVHTVVSTDGRVQQSPEEIRRTLDSLARDLAEKEGRAVFQPEREALRRLREQIVEASTNHALGSLGGANTQLAQLSLRARFYNSQLFNQAMLDSTT